MYYITYSQALKCMLRMSCSISHTVKYCNVSRMSCTISHTVTYCNVCQV